MVADTYSAKLGLLEMGTGNQNNSWGTSFNSSVTDVLDRAIAGVALRTVTGGTLDLSGSPPPAAMRQDIDCIQYCSGTLTSNQTIIVPALGKTWHFFNATSGSFQLFVQLAGGNTVHIPQGTGKYVVATGGAIFRLDRDEVGKFTYSGRPTAAPGEIVCAGQSLLRADYPDLFTAIGGTWGAVDGTHFTLPNFLDTGRFLRSATGSLAVGTYQSNQNKLHTHTGSGTSSNVDLNHQHNGTTDGGDVPDHLHALGGTYSTGTESNFHNHGFTAALVIGGNPGITSSAVFGLSNQNLTTGNNNQLHTHSLTLPSTTGARDRSLVHAHTFTTSFSLSSLNHSHTYSFTTSAGSADGSEARPESAAVLICIKY